MTTEYKRIYFDTTPFIYYLDSVQPYAQKVRSFIAESLERESSFMTSTIANTEYLVIPFREQDYEKIMEFEHFKRILNLEIIFVDNSVSTQAARITEFVSQTRRAARKRLILRLGTQSWFGFGRGRLYRINLKSGRVREILLRKRCKICGFFQKLPI